MATDFLLNCFVLGDKENNVFTVKVPKTDNVSILKKLIKEEKAHRLCHVDASDLELWEVSFPIDDHASKKSGSPVVSLSDDFISAQININLLSPETRAVLNHLKCKHQHALLQTIAILHETLINTGNLQEVLGNRTRLIDFLARTQQALILDRNADSTTERPQNVCCSPMTSTSLVLSTALTDDTTTVTVISNPNLHTVIDKPTHLHHLQTGTENDRVLLLSTMQILPLW
jgi:hypothetical protein